MIALLAHSYEAQICKASVQTTKLSDDAMHLAGWLAGWLGQGERKRAAVLWRPVSLDDVLTKHSKKSPGMCGPCIQSLSSEDRFSLLDSTSGADATDGGFDSGFMDWSSPGPGLRG